MNALRRAARVVADEGVGALLGRLGRKVLRHPPPRQAAPAAPPDDSAERTLAARVAAAKAEYQRQLGAFDEWTRAAGHDGMEHYYWYHTVDLGGGVVTPGDYDFRDQLPAFGFPDDMTGMRVLDVGSATGYFAFEFARRGAEVVSV